MPTALRILVRLCKELALPLAAGLVWAYITWRSDKQMPWSEIAKNFGAAMFFVAYFINAILRIVKKMQDDARHGSAVSAQEEVLKNLSQVQQELDHSARKIEGYTTGGDTFAYAQALVTRDKLLSIFIRTKGEFPLYELVLRVFDLDAPLPEPASFTLPNQIFLHGHLYTFACPTLTPGPLVHHQMNLPLPSGEKVRLKINWQSRNAEWDQFFVFVLVNGRYLTASVVYRNNIPIHQQMDDGFPVSEKPAAPPSYFQADEETVTRTI